MGYYSAFKITAQQCEVNPDNSSYVNEGIPTDILKNIEDEIDQFDGFGYRQGDVESGRYSYAKWEEFETDMCLLSRKFPNILYENAPLVFIKSESHFSPVVSSSGCSLIISGI